MSTSLYKSFLFFSLGIAAIAPAACGSDTDSSGSNGNGSSGSTSTSSSSGGDDPCAGLACGDMCSTCPPNAACAPEACDAAGKCVDATMAVCSLCPDTEPAEGSACPKQGLVCDLDDGIVIVCRARTQCG